MSIDPANQKPRNRIRVLYPCPPGASPQAHLRRFFARTRVGDLLLCSGVYAQCKLRQHAAQFGLLLEFDHAHADAAPDRQPRICRVVGRFALPATESAA